MVRTAPRWRATCWDSSLARRTMTCREQSGSCVSCEVLRVWTPWRDCPGWQAASGGCWRRGGRGRASPSADAAAICLYRPGRGNRLGFPSHVASKPSRSFCSSGSILAKRSACSATSCCTFRAIWTFAKQARPAAWITRTASRRAASADSSFSCCSRCALSSSRAWCCACLALQSRSSRSTSSDRAGLGSVALNLSVTAGQLPFMGLLWGVTLSTDSTSR
mmetsp:Transcript_52930/g.94417  ORF Transcript_52930/g.94417 Transcript_52930/m.94417 type:complete len:220 (+) Transcript_52930:1097-1756(+)